MPDVRLIDANAIDVGDISCSYGENCKLEDVQELIDDQPTIDAQPVKQGKWITTQKTIDDGFTTCSNCKREFYIEDLVKVGNEDGYCEFCPSCGADMRGDKDGR